MVKLLPLNVKSNVLKEHLEGKRTLRTETLQRLLQTEQEKQAPPKHKDRLFGEALLIRGGKWEYILFHILKQ